MSVAQIRQTFLDFFAARGHTIVPSSPLVPANDPTLMFTNSGMVQFKDVFLGADKRPYNRATSVQACLRAGGKHNDLENVGYTARHHTFFEMLGNWSFGDYFKKESLQWGWELLTQVYKLPPERLLATVYHEDDEAYDIWTKVIGLPPERVIRIGDNKGGKYKSDNFWMMADTGPCGPSSEIFYDHGPDVPGGPPGSPDEDGDRFIEIWNHVFMQFEMHEDGSVTRLPAPCVDTGMGLERLAAILQGVHSNYEIDLFQALIRAAARARSEARAHPLTQDVAIELMAMNKDASLSAPRQLRAEEMGQSMMIFTQALRGKLFNRYGQDWPDADVTLVEMGTLTQDGYADALAVAYTSLIDSVQSRGERFQADDRPIVFLTDEGHLITTNELLGPKIAKGTKMWRKLNIWFWLATQNLKDFPDSMDRVLSMCEYWMLLTMDKAEIEEVARFRSLTAEQRLMMESARKEPPKYTEGVLISANGQVLFRNVPPALPIALAMTEGHEKAQRKRLMEQHGCTELEAARMVARQLAQARI